MSQKLHRVFLKYCHAGVATVEKLQIKSYFILHNLLRLVGVGVPVSIMYMHVFVMIIYFKV